MSKGGSVDTSGMEASAAQMRALANTAANLAQHNYTTGANLFAGYEQPVLDLLKKMLMGGAGAGEGGFVDPTTNLLMQQPTAVANQAAGAAKRNILSSDVLGPVAKTTALEQVDLSKQATLSQSALDIVKNSIQQLMGAGQQGTNLMAGAPGAITGAAGVMGQSAGIEGMIANLQAQAAQQSNMGLWSGLRGIAQIAGMFVSPAISGIQGLFSAGAGGGSGFPNFSAGTTYDYY